MGVIASIANYLQSLWSTAPQTIHPQHDIESGGEFVHAIIPSSNANTSMTDSLEITVQPNSATQDLVTSTDTSLLLLNAKSDDVSDTKNWTKRTILFLKWNKLILKAISLSCKLSNHIPIARQLSLGRMTISFTLAAIAVISGKSSLLGSKKALKKAIKLLNKTAGVDAKFDKKKDVVKIGEKTIEHYRLWYLKIMLLDLGMKGKKLLMQSIVKHSRLFLFPLYMSSQIYLWQKYSTDSFLGYWGHRNITCDESDLLTKIALAITWGVPITLYFLRRARSLISFLATKEPLKKLTKYSSTAPLKNAKNGLIVAKAPTRLGILVSSCLNRLVFNCRTAVQGYKNSSECVDTFLSSRIISLISVPLQAGRYVVKMLKP